ncbi:GNAT family N-acetyltransferase [Methanoplanus limicola]|uniref:GCN5-related N-acetyltransferase n=1 Tax=Methanoplanus limicola DSM 2279 TaxID=937775 RepID=H1Z1D2_9EURY|nr:GNAT family N-acetyltransferase [Methanoplanus limicola]EHQ36279.1 GCN5-related N-acetyltransferase [Methanoplanus limicola DSM 2279]
MKTKKDADEEQQKQMIINSSPITIRPFEESDSPAVNRILAQSFYSKIHSLTGLSEEKAVLLAEDAKIFPDRPIDGYFVAEYMGEIAGAILLKFTGQNRPKEKIGIFPVAKKHGIFKTLKLLYGFSVLVESVRPEECYIELLATDKKFRGKGIATALIRHAGEFAEKCGFEEFTLYVASGNPAQKLYGRLGFEVQSSYKSLITKFIFGIDTWVYMIIPAHKPVEFKEIA